MEFLGDISALVTDSMLEWAMAALLAIIDFAVVIFIFKKMRCLEKLLNQETGSI